MHSETAAIEAAIQDLDERLAHYTDVIGRLVSVPSVSAEGHPAEALKRGAEAAGAALAAEGLEHIEIIELPGVHPYVYADWLHAGDAPTVLLYSHYDVQPAGRREEWQSDPFTAEMRNGRLYGRGAADDKGGLVAQIAAVASVLRTSSGVPCNVKVLVDGEEEVGSPHLARLLQAHRDRFAADVVVVTDTPNPAVGIPGITCSLRGNCIVDVEVRCLEGPVHSGRAGGVVPDPVQVLSRILGGLQRSDGRLDVGGLYPRPSRALREQRRRIRSLPLAEDAFRRDIGVLEGVALTREPAMTVFEQLWTQPSATVIGITAPALTGTSNQMADRARARISLRTVPEMESAAAGELLVQRLEAAPRFGAHVEARIVRTVPWWRTDPKSPAIAAARRALEAGYGVEPLLIGAGGSIGFADAFARTLGEVPCLLLGIEDPECKAHAPDESLHFEDWTKCARSLIHLLHEPSLARSAAAHGR